MKQSIGLLWILLLVGCQSDQPPPIVPESMAKWEAAPENSMFITEHHDSGLEAATRCWQVGKQNDCLEAVSGAGSIRIHRFRSSMLPAGRSNDKSGYGCEYHPDGELIEETIGKNNVRLISNSHLLGAGRPWTQSYVRNFMRENKISESFRYFSCDVVGRVIGNGSLASLGTTSLRHADLDQ